MSSVWAYVLYMKTTRTTKSRKSNTFTPAAWQWDPESLRPVGRIQYWSAAGSCSTINPGEARELVKAGAAFVGSAIHICQVHERIIKVAR